MHIVTIGRRTSCLYVSVTLTPSHSVPGATAGGLPAAMRAIQVGEFGGPEVLKLMDDVPVPKPEEEQVLIRVKAAGVNPADTYIRSGNYSSLPELPYTPGADAAGIVEEVGPVVTRFKPGDRVYTLWTESGSYAEYAVADVDMTFDLKDSLTFNQGAAIGVPYHTAYRALIIKGQAKAGDTVLIHGASGGVGLSACQLAHAYGMKVLGTAGSEEGMRLVEQAGATAFNHNEQGYTDQIMTASEENGVDIILEMLANKNLDTDLDMLAQGGRVVVVGSRGSVEMNPRKMMGKESSIVGCAVARGTEAELKQISASVQAGVEAGFIRPIIGQEYSLNTASQAHCDIITNSGTKGRLVISMATC